VVEPSPEMLPDDSGALHVGRGEAPPIAIVERAGQSLLTRVALGASVSAILAALVAAIVTSVATAYLVRRSDDQRLLDAASVLAAEIDDSVTRDLPSIVADERRETRHTGISFAVHDGASGAWLAGDAGLPSGRDCIVKDALHSCSVLAACGMRITAAALHEPLSWFFAFSSGLAALVAGLGAWLAARPVAGLVIKPLLELRERVGAIDLSLAAGAELGKPAGVVEVDALRETIRSLLVRIALMLRQAERFAADAAHELRTPLTALRGELELLGEDPSFGAAALMDLSRATRKVVDLQTLVERLLVLALPDRSQWSATEFLSLQDLIDDTVAGLPDGDRVRVTCAPPSGDVVVRGDAALLGILFSNALGNALKFGQRVRVSARESDSEVLLCVDDDGPGVPDGERALVFEAFVRSPLAATRKVPGHGLGLALVAHVARRHGGSARFTGGPPGAHLEIRLPRQARAPAGSESG
jgi:two-component system OmpR family sensor kinase